MNLSRIMVLDDIDRTTLIWGSILAVSIPVVAYFRSRSKKRPTLKRTWSFTSEGMRLGVFPDSVNAPDTIINAALYFDKCPSAKDVAELVIRNLLRYERFSLIPDTSGLRKSKKDYSPLDLIRQIKIAGPDKLTSETINSTLSDALDKDRDDLPWWEIVLIENTNGASACVLRVHHCLGDGLSLVNVFDKILTSADGSPMESKVTKSLLKRKNSTPSLKSIISAILHVLTLGVSKVDDSTVFFKRDKKLQYSGKRNVLLLPTVPLDFIKMLKRSAPLSARKITVNDILMFSISQAIHDYCESENDPVLRDKGERLQCRALLPASLPRSSAELQDDTLAMKNKWCMVSADLSIGFKNPLDRLQQIHKTTSFLKTSPRAYIQLAVQNNLAPLLPVSLARQTTFDVFSRHSLVLTNVPGPEKQVLFAKQRVFQVHMLFPNVIPQVSLLSYANSIFGNLVYDPALLPHGESFARLYAKALVDLAKECNIEAPKQLVAAAK